MSATADELLFSVAVDVVRHMESAWFEHKRQDLAPGHSYFPDWVTVSLKGY